MATNTTGLLLCSLLDFFNQKKKIVSINISLFRLTGLPVTSLQEQE